MGIVTIMEVMSNEAVGGIADSTDLQSHQLPHYS